MVVAALAIGFALQSWLALYYMQKWDDLAAAWVQHHPEDFPGFMQDEEDDDV